MKRIAPAIALYFLAPFVAEFLLGDFPLTLIFLLLPLSTMYGGGALFIRELVRRTGRGWPSIILLALAFGVVEEGLLTQSLFNPGYLGAHLLDEGFVPSLGIAIPWTLFVLTIHTVWSISAPIALVEEAARARRTEPWLRTPGFLVAATLFLAGSAFTFAVSYGDGHFLAKPAQLAASAVVAAGLVVAAARIPHRTADRPGAVPSPWLVLALALVAGAVVVGGRILPVWIAVAAAVMSPTRRRSRPARLLAEFRDHRRGAVDAADRYTALTQRRNHPPGADREFQRSPVRAHPTRKSAVAPSCSGAYISVDAAS